MPVANPDFSAFVQRAKDLNPELIFIFVPAGAQPAALGKAFAERGVDAGKIKIIGTGEVIDESSLKNMGDAGLSIISVWHYDYNDESKAEQGASSRPTTPSSSATRTSARSAPTTACTSSTRR